MKVQAIEKEAKEGRTYSTLAFCPPHIFEEREVNCLSSLHKVLIYIEHHSVCPLVGIGTPPPL